MSKTSKFVIGSAAIVAIAIAAGACSGTSTPDTTNDAAPLVKAPVEDNTAPAPAPQDDPYTSDGVWLVPADIAPGTYRVAPDSGSYGSGYFELCADLQCDIGGGLVKNEIVTGPSVMVVTGDLAAVRLRGVDLAPMGQ